MDNLTHSLVGAVMGQAGLKKKTGLAMPALIIGANLPDVDAACFFWLEGTEHLGFRRGITHGPPAWVLLPLVLAGLLWWFDRWQTKQGQGRWARPEDRLPVNFKWLYLLSFIGCLSHPLFDWFNVYGIRFLEPFSSQWFYGDTLFIIDVWLWAMLGLTTWFSIRREKRGGNWTKPAWIGIAVAAVYIGMNGLITLNAKSEMYFQEAHAADAIAMPVPFNPLIRDRVTVITGWPYGAMVFADGQKLGDLDISDCDTEAITASGSGAEAFLFWSRAPMIERRGEELWLRDARFLSPEVGDSFSIQIPKNACADRFAEHRGD